MGAEQQENELTDVVLCYQSMGIPLDASPVQIEQMYRSLTEENKKKLAAPEPAVREEARKSQELVNEMYDKIRGSITYRAMERDYERKVSATPASEPKVKRAAHQSVKEQNLKVNCPRCNGLITKGTKVCPICKSPLLTMTEKLLRTYFSPVKVVIYCLVLVLAAAAVFFLTQQGDRFKGGMPEFDSLEQKAPAK
jgi:hypothetical protein